ncbi:MAG: hypothetical protein QOF78_1213 [Phycisphaerales bacterium]|jgi:hypothetical protein|nr:hypothetical protein [Phycisphaerales bacterium]MEA2733856.1 hypothetical protein [Humisphaera sp.]
MQGLERRETDEWVAGLRQIHHGVWQTPPARLPAIIQLTAAFTIFRGSRGRRTLTALDDTPGTTEKRVVVR